MGHRPTMFPEYYDENGPDATHGEYGISQKVGGIFVSLALAAISAILVKILRKNFCVDISSKFIFTRTIQTCMASIIHQNCWWRTIRFLSLYYRLFTYFRESFIQGFRWILLFGLLHFIKFRAFHGVVFLSAMDRCLKCFTIFCCDQK